MFLFFFHFWHIFTHYTDEIAHITIQKEMGKRKASILDSKVSEMVRVFFPPFYFQSGWGTRAKE